MIDVDRLPRAQFPEIKPVSPPLPVFSVTTKRYCSAADNYLFLQLDLGWHVLQICILI